MFGLFVPRVTAIELAEELNSGNPPRLLDVREPEEVEVSKISDALHIPLGELEHHAPKLDKEAPWVVYCYSGARSAAAVRFLAKSGFKNVRNLDGGIRSYVRHVDPTLPIG